MANAADLSTPRRVLVDATRVVDVLMERARRHLENGPGPEPSDPMARIPVIDDDAVEPDTSIAELLPSEPGCPSCTLTGTVFRIAHTRKILGAVSFGHIGSVRRQQFRCGYCGESW